MTDSKQAWSGHRVSPRCGLPPPSGERARASEDLIRYLAEFELTLADLEPDQLAMFVAARNAAHYVEDLEIPVAAQSQNGSSNRRGVGFLS